MGLKPIGPKDYGRLSPFFEGQKFRHCPYALASILVWANRVYHPFAVVEGDTLVIGYEFPARSQHRHLLVPLSPKRDHPPEELKKIARRLGFPAFSLVPKDYLDLHGLEAVEKLFTVKELPGQSDYIYDAERLATLPGRDYAKKRNLIRQFERDLLDQDRVRAERITPGIVQECHAFIDEWCVENQCDEEGREELAREKIAARNAIQNIDTLNMSGVLVRVDGRMAAYAMGARLTEDMGVLMFEKALAGIKGLYQYLDRLAARSLFIGCRQINKEGDMGEPGLAQSKRSYFPVLRMPSYRLELK